MKATCTECQEVTFIQNKKHGLCGDCVYKKNNGGKSRQEVYFERSKNKFHGKIISAPTDYKVLGYTVDDIAKQNARNQEIAEQQAKALLNKAMKASWVGGESDENIDLKTLSIESFEFYKKPKKRKSVKKISEKQTEINKLYSATCKDMDYTTEPVCSGCLKYQGGDIKLSHSHIISREDCKRIGRPELIYARENLTYHCMDYLNNKGCHSIHENPHKRGMLHDYEKNMEYIKSISEELYLKYTKHIRK